MRQPPRSDDIDWAHLEGPYGTSEDVPDALRDLWSDDAARRAEAVRFLQENLWHQGTVYEVTAPAVPHLADAALGDVVGHDDRIWLVELLAWIAAGTSYLDVHREDLEEVSEAQLERELDWVRAARESVRKRVPEFLDRLDKERDPSMQIALADLAAQFPEDADGSRPRLERLLERETDERRRVVFEVALAALGADVDDEQLLARLPADYYAEEEIAELRARLKAEDRSAVYCDVLGNIVGSVITIDNA